MSKIKLEKPAASTEDTATGFSPADKASFAQPTGPDFSPAASENSYANPMICSTQDKTPCPTREYMSNVLQMSQKQWVDYVDTTPATVLRKQFEQEANSHRNMKRRAATKGFQIHPAFEDFKSFLRIMRPAPTKTATVDRIDPHDPEYAPGKVRWADKSTQASNKTNTILVIDPDTGETWTIDRLAKHRGMTPAALRKQRARGASDYELIHGKSFSPKPAVAPTAPVDRLAAIRSLFPTDEELEQMEAYLRRRREVRDTASLRIKKIRETYEENRLEYLPGEGEPLVTVFEEMVDGSPKFWPGKDDPEIRAKYRRNFDARWKGLWFSEMKHCDVRFENLTPHQLDQIRRVDPEWVAEKEAEAQRRKKTLEALKNTL